MTSKWEKCTLDKLVLLQRGHDLPLGKRGKGNIPVAGSNGVVGFHDKARGLVPGITIGRSGSIGNTHYFDSEYFPLNTTLYVIDFLGNHPKFVYYFFKKFDFSAFDSGSVQPSLNRNFLYQAIIDKPGIKEQKVIAHILGTLDAKIELNNKTNKTLEEISKTLFKSWFIDFDPVKAKSEGHTTGVSDDISDLFPDSFEDSELGKIPNNWEIKSLDEIAIYLNGLALQKYPSKGNSNDLPVIKIAQLRKGNSEESDKCSSDIEEKYIIRDGDILFSWSGSLLVDIWTGGFGALNQHLFKVSSDIYKKWFILYWIKHHLQEFQMIAKSKATTMGHIQRKHLSEAKVLVPPENLMTKINSIFEDLLERQINARLESKILLQIRQTILPQLISGKLRITDAEKMIDKVGI